MRQAMAATKERTKGSSVPPAESGAETALALIFRPLERGDGFRHGAIGASGYGKTEHMRLVVEQAIARGHADLVVTHDVKGAAPEFSGTLVRDGADLGIAVMLSADETRHLVFRGDPNADESLSPEGPATGARVLLRAGIPVLLNIAELDNALSDGGKAWTAPTVRWWYTQGRKLRGSFCWTQQNPRRTPEEVREQSTTIALLHMEPPAAAFIGGLLLLSDQLVALLPELVPGQFVLWVPGGGAWDGRTYRFPRRPL